MKVYDISTEIAVNMTVYKNKAEKKPIIETVQHHQTGSSHESRITMDLHTGTHIDAPLHMIKAGKTMAMYDIQDFVTQARVLDLTFVEETITKADLLKFNIESGDFLLFKTRNSFRDDFDFDFVYLEKSGASYLAEIGIKGVGTDALGIERNQPGHETHKTLLAKNIMIIEGLRLKEITPGTFLLVCAPIKLLETEAAPTRAVLIEL
jgi:arylformamidase